MFPFLVYFIQTVSTQRSQHIGQAVYHMESTTTLGCLERALGTRAAHFWVPGCCLLTLIHNIRVQQTPD
jgi:hypothetical protein